MRNIFIFCLIGLISCTNHDIDKIDYIEEIDISSAFNQDDHMFLGEVASSVSYIPLQTDSICNIKRIRNPWKDVQFCKNRIFINNNKEQLFCFDMKGNFLYQIGRQGRGPGEFIKIDGFTILEKQEVVIILNAARQQLLFYDFESDFIKEITVNNWPLQISALDNNILFESPKGRRELNDYHALFVVDQNGKSLNQLIYRQKEEKVKEEIGLCNISLFYNYSDTITYWEYFYDTVYRIVDDNTIIPKYHFNCGKNKIPFEILMKAKLKSSPKIDNYARIWRFTETKNFFFVRAGNKKRLYHILFDKHKKETYNVHFKTGDKHNFAFQNDLDEGLPFWPDGLANENKVFSMIYGYELKHILASIANKEIVINKNIYELAKNSQITDNPIIMLVNLDNYKVK